MNTKLATILLATTFLPASALAGNFGSRAQESYCSQKNLKWSYETTSAFNGELDDTDTKAFYYQVNNTAGFEYSDHLVSAGGVDAVDLFWVYTHGGVSSSVALLASHCGQTHSGNWSYGDSGRTNLIYSMYACGTLKRDKDMISRWRKPFGGGLKYVTGSDGTLYSGWTTTDTGEDYADGLQKKKKIKRAWFDGISDWWLNQDMAVMATGNSKEDCEKRRDNMTWQTIWAGYPKLKPGDIRWYCWSWLHD